MTARPPASARLRRACTAAIACAIAILAVAVPGARAESLGAITEFPIAGGGSPAGIATGPDGNLWFTEYGLGFGEHLGRLTPAGQLSLFSIPGSGSGVRFITQGPDSNMWFTEYAGNQIGRITPTGQVILVEVPGAGGPNGITAGPDGNLWFTETAADAIGRINPAGEVTTFPVPTPAAGPVGIAQGPEGDLWFTEYGFGSGRRLGRITTAGQITEFELPDAASGPYGIAAGSDGQMWFTENAHNAIGRIDPATGQVTTTPIPTEHARPLAIATGADGDMWFTEYGEGTGQKIGRISPGGEITEYTTPTEASGPYGLATGSDGNVWFTEFSRGRIGRIGTGALGAALTGPTITGNRQAGSPQTCNAGTWSSLLSFQPLANLFAPDGYHWTIEGGPYIGAGPTFIPTFAQEAHKLYCAETVTYPVPLLLSDTNLSTPITVIPPPPTVARARISPALWSEGGSPLVGGKGSHRHVPVGSFIGFTMNESAPVAFDFEQRRPGRREGKFCEVPNPENARRRHCSRTVTVAEVSLVGQMGSNHVYFLGGITARRKLPPGRYTLVIVAANTTGSAPPVSLPFTVTR
jgi:streptogramin lyase